MIIFLLWDTCKSRCNCINTEKLHTFSPCSPSGKSWKKCNVISWPGCVGIYSQDTEHLHGHKDLSCFFIVTCFPHIELCNSQQPLTCSAFPWWLCRSKNRLYIRSGGVHLFGLFHSDSSLTTHLGCWLSRWLVPFYCWVVAMLWWCCDSVFACWQTSGLLALWGYYK